MKSKVRFTLSLRTAEEFADAIRDIADKADKIVYDASWPDCNRAKWARFQIDRLRHLARELEFQGRLAQQEKFEELFR